jgi:hypothetical protein
MRPKARRDDCVQRRYPRHLASPDTYTRARFQVTLAPSVGWCSNTIDNQHSTEPQHVSPMPRETFLADATDIVGTTRWTYRSRLVVVRRIQAPRCTRGGCVMFSGDGESTVVRKPALKEVDNVCRSSQSPRTWHGWISASCTAETMLNQVSKLCGRQSVADCACEDGRLSESFQEYALKDYCSTGCIDLATTGDSRLMILIYARRKVVVGGVKSMPFKLLRNMILRQRNVISAICDTQQIRSRRT